MECDRKKSRNLFCCLIINNPLFLFLFFYFSNKTSFLYLFSFLNLLIIRPLAKVDFTRVRTLIYSNPPKVPHHGMSWFHTQKIYRITWRPKRYTDRFALRLHFRWYLRNWQDQIWVSKGSGAWAIWTDQHCQDHVLDPLKDFLKKILTHFQWFFFWCSLINNNLPKKWK